jgi:hypothetical protein
VTRGGGARVAALLAVTVVAWPAAPALAASPSITVEVHQSSGVPSSYFQLPGNPGSNERAGSIEVLNRTGRPVAVSLDPVDGITTNTLGSAYASRGQPINGSARWLRLGSTSLTVPAHGARAVAVALEVPSSAKPGDYLSGVAVQPLGQVHQTRPSHGLQIAEVYRYAVGVELTLPGPRIPRVRFTGANVERTPASVAFSLLAKNDGNVILKNVYGRVEVTQGTRLVVSARIPAGTFVSHTAIQIPVLAPHEHPAEGTVYRIRAKLIYKGGVASLDTVANLDTLVRFGRHAADVQSQYLPRSKNAGGTFWAVLGAGLAVALLLLLALGVRYRRRRPLLTRAATLALLERMVAVVDAGGQAQSVIHIAVKNTNRAPRRRLIKLLRQQLRATDAIGDLGGDGLMIILPDTGGAFAGSLAGELAGLLARTGAAGLAASPEAASAGRREDLDGLADWLRDRGLDVGGVGHARAHVRV